MIQSRSSFLLTLKTGITVQVVILPSNKLFTVCFFTSSRPTIRHFFLLLNRLGPGAALAEQRTSKPLNYPRAGSLISTIQQKWAGQLPWPVLPVSHPESAPCSHCFRHNWKFFFFFDPVRIGGSTLGELAPAEPGNPAVCSAKQRIHFLFDSQKVNCSPLYVMEAKAKHLALQPPSHRRRRK